ncbi:MobF family relaxase (plasmid) [Nocardia sp. CA-084685]|uniref:MobF family relaxase n=1 Tax=Nocardia sp. CA-084685 TaxID=3239970 RepID=UPI003D950BAE
MVPNIGTMMSLHKLTADQANTSAGYRMIARHFTSRSANNSNRPGHAGHAATGGPTSGRWLGSGLTALGLTVGDPVSQRQLQALFGHGLHPNADAVIDDLLTQYLARGEHPAAALRSAQLGAQLGRPYSKFTPRDDTYRNETARAYVSWNVDQGRPPDAQIPEDERALIRAAVARRMFTDEAGRPPKDDRELTQWVARALRTPPSKATAAYRLRCSPVKSVSTFWALAPDLIRQQILAAQHAAIDDTLAYLETHAVRTRGGTDGHRRIAVDGVIAVMSDHGDSWAGDPNLYTTVTISNKVHRIEGGWGALDGWPIHCHAVAASEIFNTRLEHHLELRLGVVFAPRESTTDKRPVREIQGVDPRLNVLWSSRRTEVAAELASAVHEFEITHQRPPSPAEKKILVARAADITRASKPTPRSDTDSRIAWAAEAARVLGSAEAVQTMVAAVLHQPTPLRPTITDKWITEHAAVVAQNVTEAHTVVQPYHLRAEAERHLRGTIAPQQWPDAVDRLIAVASAKLSAKTAD